MNDIVQLLVLIILGLLGITRLQAHKTKDLKKDVQKAQDTAIRKEKELKQIHETQQEITAIENEPEPEKIEAPEPGDTAGRLDRLNRLHERANGRGK